MINITKFIIILLLTLPLFSLLFLLPFLQFLGPDTGDYFLIIGIFLLALWEIISGKFALKIFRHLPLQILLLFMTAVMLNFFLVIQPAITFSPFSFNIVNGQTLFEAVKWLAVFFFALLLFANIKSEKWRLAVGPFDFAQDHPEFNRRIGYWLFAIILIFSCVVLYQKFTSSTSLLPIPYGIKIAYKTIANSPFTGAGPGLFNNAYNLSKPIIANSELPLETSYNTSSTFILELLTTLGLPVFLLFLFLTGFGLLKTVNRLPYTPMIIFGFLSILFLPLPVSAIMCFVGLLVISGTTEIADNFDPQKSISLSQKIVMGLIVFLLLVISFQFLFSQFFYQKARNAKEPLEVYQSLQNAINIYPNIYYYHSLMAGVSLSLADSLAKKDQITNNDKILMAKLIPQAINEAKTAVKLSPTTAESYEKAGMIYKNLIGVVPEANKYSLTYYQQAIAFNPLSPVYHSQIASIYLLNKDYEDAEKFYRNSLSLKKDYYPALYGLGQIKLAQEKVSEALPLLKKSLQFTPTFSPDYLMIKKLIIEIETIFFL